MKYPIRLTAFEEFFFYNDTREAPSTFLVQIEFSAPLEHNGAEQALELAVRRHLLSSSRIELRRGKPYWVACDSKPEIQWKPNSYLNGVLPDRYLDIQANSPIRIWGHDGKSGKSSSLLFLVHHTAFDGLGFSQWLGDWIDAYRDLLNVDRAQLEIAAKNQTDQPQLLELRCRPTQRFLESLSLIRGQWKSIRAVFQVMRRKVISLLPSDSENLEDDSLSLKSYACLKLTAKETALLRETAVQLNTSVNSLLGRDLFAAISQWKLDRGDAWEGTHIRLMIPINERKRIHRKMSACNHCTMINLDRTPEEIESPQQLLDSIHQEMSVIDKWKLSLNFWRALACLRILPGGLKQQSAGEQVSATALFTNVGRVLRKYQWKSNSSTDKIYLTKFDCVATLNPNMPVAFSMYSFQNRLSVSLLYDNKKLTEVDAEKLIGFFREQIESSVSSKVKTGK